VTEDAKLSFVLPVALANTGRPGSDLGRLQLLLESFAQCVRPEDVGTFLVITRHQDMEAVAASLAESCVADFVDLIDENVICPELVADPETFHDFPTRNKGWYRQQLLKLGAAKHVRDRFYMTLDSDVVFVRAFRPTDLIRDGRSVVNVQTMADFTALFSNSAAEDSSRIRTDRDRRAETILDVQRVGSCFYGETPVLLGTDLVTTLLAHIEAKYQKSWAACLLTHRPWTEYSLYFTFAEATGLFDTYHARGSSNSVLRLSDSLWYPASDYRSPRGLDDWTWSNTTDNTGVAVVVQSYLGYDIEAVRDKVRDLRTAS